MDETKPDFLVEAHYSESNTVNDQLNEEVFQIPIEGDINEQNYMIHFNEDAWVNFVNESKVKQNT